MAKGVTEALLEKSEAEDTRACHIEGPPSEGLAASLEAQAGERASGPNDILSYPIPPKFADEYTDSRMCPQFTNVTLNVAPPINLFGLSEVANPLSAHVDYDHDARVIALMAHGLGHDDQAEIISERCTWLETRSE